MPELPWKVSKNRPTKLACVKPALVTERFNSAGQVNHADRSFYSRKMKKIIAIALTKVGNLKGTESLNLFANFRCCICSTWAILEGKILIFKS